MLHLKRMSTGCPVAETFLVGWSFAYTIEGIGGFGAPVALATPMLVALGHDPFNAVVAVVVLNCMASHLGTVGMMIWCERRGGGGQDGKGKGRDGKGKVAFSPHQLLPPANIHKNRFGFGQMELGDANLVRIAGKAAALMALPAFVVVPVAAAFLCPWPRLRRAWVFVAASIASAVAPTVVVAAFNHDIPVVVGAQAISRSGVWGG
jgi:lactate permease